MTSHSTQDIEIAKDGHRRILAEVEQNEDPHRAALEDNPAEPECVSWSTALAVLVYFPEISVSPS